jgi:hypothetical protein
VSIQRIFLWGGGTECKKVCWVSEDRICQPKEKGGLRIKNVRIEKYHLRYGLLLYFSLFRKYLND